MINVKAPERGSVGSRSDRGSSGVLVVAMDDAGLAEVLPVAYARAAISGRSRLHDDVIGKAL